MIRIKRLFKSFTYAGRGLVKVIKEEQNFKIELIISIVVLVLAVCLRFNYLELAILVVVIGLLLLAEVINSVVELISDVLKPKLDHYVKDIKDLAAGAVFIAALIAVATTLIIFAKNLFL
jgi:diacylglycerol kinase